MEGRAASRVSAACCPARVPAVQLVQLVQVSQILTDPYIAVPKYFLPQQPGLYTSSSDSDSVTVIFARFFFPFEAPKALYPGTVVNNTSILRIILLCTYYYYYYYEPFRDLQKVQKP